MLHQKINIIQFLPYFPPHKGGLEDVAEWISSMYVGEGFGEVLNVVFSVGQEQECGSYEKDGYKVIILPAFDVVPGFPFPKFWRREFWQAFQEVRKFDAEIIQTHTRFFLSSFIGGIYAKITRTKWVHIEHGSGYVVSDRWIVTFFSKLFDKTIGFWILWASDSVIAISEACKKFVQTEFVNRKVVVVYRGMNIPDIPKTPSIDGKIRITFVGRLVHLKGVQYLLEAIKNIVESGYEDIFLKVYGEGDQSESLSLYIQENNLQDYIELCGRNKERIELKILPETDILINPSLQEGLPTTVVEALLAKCMVVATDVGGTREISDKEDIIIVPPSDSTALYNGIKLALGRYEEISGASYELVREKFDSKGNIERMYEVYAKLTRPLEKLNYSNWHDDQYKSNRKAK